MAKSSPPRLGVQRRERSSATPDSSDDVHPVPFTQLRISSFCLGYDLKIYSYRHPFAGGYLQFKEQVLKGAPLPDIAWFSVHRESHRHCSRSAHSQLVIASHCVGRGLADPVGSYQLGQVGVQCPVTAAP